MKLDTSLVRSAIPNRILSVSILGQMQKNSEDSLCVCSTFGLMLRESHEHIFLMDVMSHLITLPSVYVSLILCPMPGTVLCLHCIQINVPPSLLANK